jgi:hypothetical protein
MAGSRKRTQRFWYVNAWHNRAQWSVSACTSREGAIKASYTTTCE